MKEKNYLKVKVRELLNKYKADSIRYYFISNEAIKKDFNFSWSDFINSNNGELLGKWGNFVNRTLVFINKSFDGKIEDSNLDSEIESKLKELFKEVGSLIDDGNVKDGINKIFNFLNYSNKYFDELAPWTLAKTDIEKCKEVLHNCLNIILNVNTLLKPYLPFSSEKVEEYLNIKTDKWEYIPIKDVKISKKIEPLYERYEKVGGNH